MTRDPRIRIAHIIYRLDYGGLENILTILINRLPADRFRHDIICLTDATDFGTRITAPEVGIHTLNKPPGKAIGLYRRIWRLLRDIRPDIVHTRNLPALDMVFVAWLAGVGAIVHGEHGRDMSELSGGNRKYNLLRRATRLVTDRYVTVSAELANWLRTDIGIPPGRITHICNGVDTDRFSPAAADDRAALPAGFGAEISACLAERGLTSLVAPVERVTGYDTVMPYPRLEAHYIPTERRIAAAVRRTMEYS